MSSTVFYTLLWGALTWGLSEIRYRLGLSRGANQTFKLIQLKGLQRGWHAGTMVKINELREELRETTDHPGPG
jgi:hypothetical protein